MTDMTLEQMAAKIRSHADFVGSLGGSGELMDSVELSDMADAIDAHLAKAAQPVAYRYALSTGKWTVFISKARAKFLSDEGAVVEPLYAAPPTAAPAQPVEAVDDYTSEGFAEWINSAYSFKGDGSFTRFNMEVAYAAGSERSALAHPRPTGDEAVSLDEVSADIDALIARVEQGTLSRADVVSLVRRKIGPSWQDRSAPTGEQDGEAIDWTDDDVETLRCLRDAVGKYANLKKLWVPTIEKMLARARHVDNATAMPYAKPRAVGVPEGYRLVPVEPTDDMCRNAREKIGIGSNVAHHVWHWMIAAAPDGEVG